MKIYVAGASAEIADIEAIIAKLKAAGHTITHDWTVDVRNAGNNASPDDDGVRVRAALADLRGVVTSDLTWVRQPESASTGAWVELGGALAMKEGGFPVGRRPLIVVSGPSRKCIFSDLADHRFTRHEDALEFVLGLAK
ncbi:MAG TPA: hypothetical protein VFA98_06345 [Thermoanaerobaculia bacterium]|jgi:hypothetical protein|nr:hypothetical protein [Thermoanaerobaculia bacterium]